MNRKRKVYYRSMPEPSSLALEAFWHLSRSQCRYTVGGNRAWQEGCSPMRFSCFVSFFICWLATLSRL